MFLNRLTPKEKEAFLWLAHHCAHVDDELSNEEELVIAKYCMEMQMDDIEYDESQFDLNKALSSFTIENHKKIALLEIMALLYADDHLAKEEQDIINEMVEYFGLNPNLATVYKEWAKSILSLFVQGEALIHL